MKTTKFIITAVLTVALTLSTMGCGQSSGKSTPSQTSTKSNSNYQCVVLYPTLGTTPKDLPLIEDAVNKISESKIGVSVKFDPVNTSNIQNTVNLMVSSGEKLDLFPNVLSGGINSYINKGAVISLDDLVAKYGKDIEKVEGIVMSGGYYNGKLYAVPNENFVARDNAFYARKDILDKYHIKYDDNHVYTIDELGRIFATVKAGEGKGFYCIAADNADNGPSEMFGPVDYLGSTLASGCLMNYGAKPMTVTNFFASDQFAKSCEYAHDWYQKGYYAPDCNTLTDPVYILEGNNKYLGYFVQNETFMILEHHSESQKQAIGTDMVALHTSHLCALTQDYQNVLWLIPTTCDNPEKTMQWLNLSYANADIVNLLNNGIEGKHYVFTDGSKEVIDYPKGVNAQNVSYLCVLNVWGDLNKMHVRKPFDSTVTQKVKSIQASLKPEYTSKGMKYCFNADSVKAQFSAVTDVIKQYRCSLSLGVVDPKTTMPKFLSALKAAGINDIIAQNQKQLNSWLASEKNK